MDSVLGVLWVSFCENFKALSYENYEEALECLEICKKEVAEDHLLEQLTLDYKKAGVLAKLGDLDAANKLILDLNEAPERLMGPWLQWRFYLETNQLQNAYVIIKKYLDNKDFEREKPEYIYGESIAYSSMALFFAKSNDILNAVKHLLKASLFESALYIMQVIEIIIAEQDHSFDIEISKYLSEMYLFFDKKQEADLNFSGKNEYMGWIEKINSKGYFLT